MSEQNSRHGFETFFASNRQNFRLDANGNYFEDKIQTLWQGWEAAVVHLGADLATREAEKAVMERLREQLGDKTAEVLRMRMERADRGAEIAEMRRLLDGVSQEAIAGGWTARGISEYAKSLEARIAELEGLFKNFHRSLCARFDYVHDERDWKRDLVSLEEHIAKHIAKLTDETRGLRNWTDGEKQAFRERIAELEAALSDSKVKPPGFESYSGQFVDANKKVDADHVSDAGEMVNAEDEAVRRDAARYRFLRVVPSYTMIGGCWRDGVHLDSAIDAAIAAAKEGK